jgi:hypothetical protein
MLIKMAVMNLIQKAQKDYRIVLSKAFLLYLRIKNLLTFCINQLIMILSSLQELLTKFQSKETQRVWHTTLVHFMNRLLVRMTTLQVRQELDHLL